MEQEEKKLPDGLEKAAMEYANEAEMNLTYGDIPYLGRRFYYAFKAGAEWVKAKMMEEAVEIEVKEDAGGYPIVPLDAIELYDYENDKPLAKAGDKVKVIVIKGD